MIALLRIAIIFKYVDILDELPDFIIEADSHRLQLSLTQAWQDSHPLTVWELQQAIPALAELNVDLDLSTTVWVAPHGSQLLRLESRLKLWQGHK